jgi:predicted ribosomally synthesized peptide with nif11-like leader
MSQADFQKFIQSVQSDEALQAALADKLKGGQSIPADDLIALADQHGYSFTVDEAQDELSDAALEGVAGGTTSYFLKIDGIDGESLLSSYNKIEYSTDTSTFDFIKISY